ncbi:MAG: phospholipid carrier-dependent glycosyltransferase, partial [Anaerolineae bacterium]
WDSTAQLMLQGYLPYRDFFATLPPVGIYLLAGILRLVDAPWGSAASFMATRYASVFYGFAIIIASYFLGRKLAGQMGGLVAASLLAIDGMVIAVDRRVLLEPPVNAFSVITMLVYCSTFDPTCSDSHSRKRAALTGFLGAVCTLIKTPGAVVVFTLVSVSLLRRRFREAAIILLSFVVSWLALSACFLARCPEDFIKQVYFFQLLRPPDGIIRRSSRLLHIWNYTTSWLTVRMGLIGALFTALESIRRRKAGPWLLIMVWVGYIMALIFFTSSYWPQYYVQLAVPLALLAGGLLDIQAWENGVRWRISTPNILRFLAAFLLIGLLSGRIAGQWTNVIRMLDAADSTYLEIARFLSENTESQSVVLAFEPNYTFLASRPLAGAQPGHFLVDSYGEMLYVNLGIREKSLPALLNAVLSGRRERLQEVFWRSPAQQQALAAFERADYVIIDGRARYQLEPQILKTIREQSTELFANSIASLRKKQ